MKLFLDNPHLSAYFGLVAVLFISFGASFLVPKFSVARKWLGISLIFVPVIYFFLILDAHLVNIPFTDDFNLLETVYNFQHAPDFTSKIKVLFEQVNQHRFAFERIVMLVMVFFTGTVNIKAQILIGNLALLGMAYLLFKSLKKEKLSFYYFIPVPYLLFSLIYWENAYWGIAALQNTPLILFAFLTAYAVGKGDNRGYFLGIAAALLTTFTSGSGLLAWIIGFVILVFQKRFKLAGGWIFAAVLVILFYFLFDYQIVPATGEKVWTHPLFNFIFVLGFWGNGLYLDIRHPLVSQFHPDLILCVLVGGLIFLLFLGWFLRILTRRITVWSDWFLWGAMMFSMGTGAMFVISRPLNNYFMFGGNVFSRRYMIFGVALLATVYICLIILVKNWQIWRKWIAGLVGAGFVLLNFVSYYLSIVQVRKMHDDLVIDSYHWKNYNTFLTAGDLFGDIPFWNHPTRMRNMVNALESQGLTDFYQFNTIPVQQELLAETNTGRRFSGDFNATFHYRNTDNNIPTRYYRFTVDPAAGSVAPSYFVFSSDTLNLVLPAVPVPNKFDDFLKTGSYYGDSYQYALFNLKLPKGEFKVYILTKAEEDWKSEFTGKSIVIK
ncbi:hypothetical protein [Dyadobacter sp. CY343]|uniref:hypothetical protein n=1 Tax=Dyadobacter sp. CY343 TaxID=2907299 RepID=UPI001F44B431|nr:hypothetical protein [Dyadobacter sp. CY343]MCE7061450.1 hypothetical protein [Dyadobacter sp. CY343]